MIHLKNADCWRHRFYNHRLNNEAVLTLVQFHWQVVKTPVVDSFLEAAGRFLQPIGALCVNKKILTTPEEWAERKSCPPTKNASILCIQSATSRPHFVPTPIVRAWCKLDFPSTCSERIVCYVEIEPLA